MTTFDKTRDERTLEFTLKGNRAEVTSYRGTNFVPTRCQAHVVSGEIVSLSLERLDENGWGIDDPAGPEGAELAVDYSSKETDLPPLAREALVAIRWAIR